MVKSHIPLSLKPLEEEQKEMVLKAHIPLGLKPSEEEQQDVASFCTSSQCLTVPDTVSSTFGCQMHQVT